MGEKEIERYFTHEDRVKIRFTTRKGVVVWIKLVQYEAYIEDKWRAILRYDTAHGYLHRDIEHPKGDQEKLKIPYADLGEALTEAIDHIERNWQFYRKMYEEEMQ